MPAVTPGAGNPGSTSSSTVGVFPVAPGTCPSAAWLTVGDWAGLVGAGGKEMDSAGTGRFRSAATIARVGCNAPGSGAGSRALAASWRAVSDGSGEPARRAAGARLAASAAAAASPCGVASIPFSNVSMPAGVSRRGAASDDGADEVARPSPAAAPLAATRPASNSVKMPSAAVASAPGAWSAVSRDEAPGVDTRTF